MNTLEAPASAGLRHPATPALSNDAGTAPPPVDEIVVVPYDAAWPQRYRVESQLIHMALADLQPVIEHIGSTSVPGLAAKPTIDMLVGVRSLAEFGRHADLLVAYGYEYQPEHERLLPDRRFFKRVVRSLRTHHVHVVEHGGAYWQRYMAFRDRLRRDAGLAARYAALKRGLAARHRFDRNAYTNGKTGFIEDALAGCAARARCSGVMPAAVTRVTASFVARRARSDDACAFASAPASAGVGALTLRPHFGFAS